MTNKDVDYRVASMIGQVALWYMLFNWIKLYFFQEFVLRKFINDIIIPFVTIALFVILILSSVPEADGQTNVDARAGWTPPTYGMPVHHYELQLSTNLEQWVFYGSTPDTFMTVEVSFTDSHRVRVRGIAAGGEDGLWSPSSNSYRPSDFPGKPGQPYAWEIK